MGLPRKNASESSINGVSRNNKPESENLQFSDVDETDVYSHTPSLYVSGVGFSRYDNALRSLVPFRSTTSNEEGSRIDDVGLFSFALYKWLSSYMYKVYKKGFGAVKIPPLSPYDRCNLNTDRLEFFWKDELKRRGPEKASMARVVWRFIGTRVIFTSIIFTASVLCGFASQMLLMRKLLQHVESSDESWEIGIMWAGLLIIGESLRTFLYSWQLAIGYRTALRLKLACMTLLYRKVIHLKYLGSTSIGQLINLFVVDSQRLYEMVVYGPMVVGGPIMTVCGVWYVTQLLGPMALIGIFALVLFLPTQYGISKLAGYLRVKTLRFSDVRIRLTNEILNCIQLIKMYSWERRFTQSLRDVRKEEKRFILGTNYSNSINSALAPTMPIIATIITFLAHTATGESLTAAQAFPISTFFGNQMSTILLNMKSGYTSFIEGFIAFGRLKKALLIKDASCPISRPIVETQAIAISHGTFAYLGSSDQVQDNSKGEKANGKNTGDNSGEESEKTKLKSEPQTDNVDVLFDITFEAAKGKLVGICGQVGSGKSSLLLAALGQLHATEGRVMRQGSCAYVSQQAWIVNATLRDNILFGEPYDVQRYRRTVYVCSLTHDFQILPGGDQTEIGERGVNLSGGQKQRIALARALYANRDIYFLDDPLSAVDAHVGLHIFDNLITGALRGRTILFVTHQIQYLNHCDYVYMMRDGRIAEHGTHNGLMKKDGEYAAMVHSISKENPDTDKSEDVDDKVEIVSDSNLTTSKTVDPHEDSVQDGSPIQGADEEEALKAKSTLVEAEKKEEGVVKASTYLCYAKAAGGWLTIILVLLLTVFNVGSSSFSTWWLAEWLNAGGGNITEPGTNITVISDNINDNPNSSMYQTVYAASIAIILGSNFIRSFVFCKSAIDASTNLHNTLFQKIMKSPMKFFETTPIGRLQNLFSKDMDVVDILLPDTLDLAVRNTFMVLNAIVLICIVFPWIILPLIIPGLLYYFYGKISRIALRGLIRVQNTSLGVILSHITASIQGLNTINAFGKHMDFKTKFNELSEFSTGVLFMTCSASSWITVRVGGITVMTTAAVAVLVVVMKGTVPAALGGLALTYAMYIAGIFQSIIQTLTATESQFVSVERMKQYIDVPEVEGDNGKTVKQVQPNWPHSGLLIFDDVRMSYRKDSPLVLKGISITIQPREKIGIVGRTGSGKSSLTVALYRLVEICGGKIIIDDVDISEVALDQLRSRLSIIPQDPILFSGTIRSNLDPFKKNTDAEIWEALEKTRLKERVLSIGNGLDSSVGASGDSLSVGEKQLLCLARALLRGSKILLLDEATAAVDPETEVTVQNTIQRDFIDSTVLTIAHRLQTVVTCDKILVMDDGQVAEFDTPKNLLADENSQFSQMMAAAERAANR